MVSEEAFSYHQLHKNASEAFSRTVRRKAFCTMQGGMDVVVEAEN